MSDEIIVNHETVEIHASEIEDMANEFNTGVLPSAGYSTLTACENSRKSFEASQELLAALNSSLYKDAKMIREIGTAFKEKDNQIAGQMIL